MIGCAFIRGALHMGSRRAAAGMGHAQAWRARAPCGLRCAPQFGHSAVFGDVV